MSNILVGNMPNPPRELCSSERDYEFGIVSPSLFSNYFYGFKHSENVDKYFEELENAVFKKEKESNND